MKHPKFAIVRHDKSPQEWWDGYYDDDGLAKSMAKYWSKVLGIHCYTMLAKYPDLPDSGYQGGRS